MTIATALVVWPLILLAVHIQPWVFGILAVLVAFIGALLVVIGSGSNFYKDDSKKRDEANADETETDEAKA